jgi:hypothetical protein
MSEVNIEEMDLDSMSIEDLDSMLNESEGNPQAPEVAETKEEVQEIQEEAIETSPSDESLTEEVVESEPEGKPDEEQTEEQGSEVEPQYRGKSKEDLLEMQRNANRKISQQNNEIYHLKKKMDEFFESQNKRSEELKSEPKEDVLSRYEKDDINAIQTLIERSFEQRESAKLEKTKAEKESAMAEHDQMWDSLKILNPELFRSIEGEALDLMRSDAANTYESKGWMKKFISERVKGNSNQVKPAAKPVVKKRTTTVRSSSSVPSKVINKSVDNMTADEYAQFMASKGVKF